MIPFPFQAGQLGLSSSSGGTQSLWAPANLTVPPSLWFNDDSAVGDEGGGVIVQWNDISGNGYHFIQVSGSGRRPSAITAGLNGRRTVRFDGVDDMLFNNDGAPRALTQNQANFAEFVIYKKTATDGGTARLATFFSNNAGGSRFSLAVSGTGGGEANKTRGIARRLDGDAAASLVQATSLGTAWQMALFRVEYANTDGYLDVNGANDQTNTSFTSSGNTSATGSSVAISMGGSPAGTGATPLTSNAADIEIAERIFIRAALTQADVDRLFGYAAWRWGLTADLPALHPYKSTPPYV